MCFRVVLLIMLHDEIQTPTGSSNLSNFWAVLSSLLINIRYTRQLYLGKHGLSLGKVAFSLVADFTLREFTLVKWPQTVENARNKTLDGLKGRSFSPVKPINEKKTFGHRTCSAWQSMRPNLQPSHPCARLKMNSFWTMQRTLIFNSIVRFTERLSHAYRLRKCKNRHRIRWTRFLRLPILRLIKKDTTFERS